jgi:uncharacterized protein
MSNDLDLRKLHVLKFAQAATHAKGQAPLAGFSRLMLEQDHVSEGEISGLADEPKALQSLLNEKTVNWELEGFFDEDELSSTTSLQARAGFVLKAQAAIKMTCQRCLGLCVQTLEVDRTFRFVRDEQTALEMDDASEDEFLVLSNAFDVLELMEEELIMALPLVPLHAHCPVPLTQQLLNKSSIELEMEEKRPNPFAVLSALKTKKQ